ncbi:MAG: (5-formylfuran-3-yl)methyl phosphate synthase [Fuerstiella sp.]
MTIRLLVSVRSGDEAEIAVTAGADIIDVKEPAAGSLGYAGRTVIADVLNAVNGRCPVSAALGECVDHLQLPPDSTNLSAPDSDCLTQLHYVKLGLSQTIANPLPQLVGAEAVCLTNSETTAALPDWRNLWRRVRQNLQPKNPPSGSAACASAASAAATGPGWVAVAYADERNAGAPAAADVLSAAIDSRCVGLLIDTFSKETGTTLDWISEAELCRLKQSAQEAGLFFALAGKLGTAHLAAVQSIRPDIFAVRGAVCEGGDRTATLSGQKITRLKKALT